MKTLILSLVISTGVVAMAETAQNSQKANVVTVSPGITYSTKPFPWETARSNPANPSGSLDRLLANLRDSIEAVTPTLSALAENENASYATPGPAVVESGVAFAPPNNLLPAKDLSTLLSQDLSVNLSQNLATSLAVPTTVPWSTWGNGPRIVLASVDGQIVTMPGYPPRTAWGNGPGVVVTTPGGAVVSMVPSVAPAENAAPSPDVARQLSNVQDDLDRVLQYLETVNTPNAVAPSTPAGQPPVYLNPTGR
jgi:hypothetical protein